MNFVTKLLTSPVTEALGWTLLHSFWFGFICFATTWLALRLIPIRMSNMRYSVATAGLVLILISSVVVFSMMMPEQLTPNRAQGTTSIFSAVSYQMPQQATYDSPGTLIVVASILRSNMSLIVFIWILGALLTSLKVFAGYWYVGRIRLTSTVVVDSWQDRIQALAQRLGVYRYVVLAESSMIQAPVVMGYIKPMILIPVGMMSGLSTEQLETIFIHELTHIRRGDYLVNIFQSFVEAIYFFNPFVWALSSTMRREREHCCDDAVVELHGNPLVYVKALASLEEARLTRAGIALSLAEDKNHLLKRIKRIMEKSVQRYSGREKLVPAILLVLGLMCASWLTIQTETRSQQRSSAEPVADVNSKSFNESTVTGDTTIKDRSQHKKTIIRIHENGDSETFEVYDDGEDRDDDDDMHFMMKGMSMHMDPIPPIPPIDMDFHFEMPEIPEIQAMDFEMPPMPPMGPIDIHVSIPPIPAFPAMNFDFSDIAFDTAGMEHWDSHHWLEFQRQFEKSFNEKFHCIPKNGAPFLSDTIPHDGDNEDRDNDREEWGAAARGQLRAADQQMEVIKSQIAAAVAQRDKLEQNSNENRAINKQLDAIRQQEQQAVVLAYKAHEFENAAFNKSTLQALSTDNSARVAQLARNRTEFEAGVAQMDAARQQWTANWTERIEESHRAAKKELVKDGYLKDSDKINNIDIDLHDNEMTINGIKIKEKDKAKYKQLLAIKHPGRME